MADDLSTKGQPAGTTRIENGIAYDVTGKALGPANVPEEKDEPIDYGALAKQAGGSTKAPDYAALAKQAGGSTGDAGAAPNYAAAAKQAGGRPAVGTGTAASIGPRRELSAPMFVPLGPLGGLTIPEGAMSHFHNFLEDVQGDVKSGTHSTWVGSMLDKIAPGGWKGTHYGVSEGAGNLIDAFTGPMTGIPEALESIPEVTEGHPVRAVNKLLGGGFKTVAPVLAVTAPAALAANPEALIYGMATQHVAQQTALAMGADEDTAELVGNVTGIFTASKVHTKAEYLEFEHAVNQRTNAGSAFKSRYRELEISRQQSEVAQQRAIDAAQKEINGQGTKADTDAARSTASEAAANQRKAQEAFYTANTELSEAEVRLKRFSRKAQDKYQKNLQSQLDKTKKGVDTSRELMQKAIPAKGTDLYEPDAQGDFPQYESVRAHLEAAKEAGKPVGTILEARNASEQAREGIETKVMANVDKYANEPLVKSENPEESIKGLVRGRLQEMAKEDGNFEGAEDHLDEFNLSDISVKEGQKTLTKLNNYLRAMKKSSNNWDIYNQIETNPKFAAYYFLADELREKLYDNFEDHGVSGIKEARGETKNLINFRNAADAQLRRNQQGTVVRGSGAASPVRKLIGKFVKRGAQDVGAGIGASVAGIPGAVMGADVGSMLGGAAEDFIAPEGMTRDQHVGKSMSTRGTTRKPVKIEGKGTAPIVPSSALPKDYPYPSDLDGPPHQGTVELTPREHSDLHAALATYSKQTDLSKVPYEELESNFRHDMQDKIDAGADLTPKETQLLEKILQADAKDNSAYAEANKSSVARAQATTEEAQKADAEDLQRGEQWKNEGKRPTEPNPALKGLGRGEEAPLVSHSPAMKAHELASEITGVSIPSELVHIHEWSHVALGVLDGLEPEEIRSNVHPEAPEDSAATTVFSAPDIINPEGNVDLEKFATQEAKWITQKMAGPASFEIFGGMSKLEALSSKLSSGDVRTAKALIRGVHENWTDLQVDQAVEAAYDRAHDFLSQPHIADRIRANAAVRESGLPKTHHVSRGRILNFADDLRGAHEEFNQARESSTNGGQSSEGGSKVEEAERAGEEKKPGGDRPGSSGAARPAVEESKPAGGRDKGVTESQISVPKESSTGDEKVDAAIKSGGAIPGGVQKAFEYTKKDGTEVKLPAMAYFHDPKTGTSLNLPMSEVTPETVKQHIAESRKQYGFAEKESEAEGEPAQKKLISGAHDLFPESDETDERSYIEPDGTFRSVMDQDHFGVSELYPGEDLHDEDAINQFMDDSNWLRTGKYEDSFLIHGGKNAPTSEQIVAALKQRKYWDPEITHKVMIETPHGSKELADTTTPGDIRRTIESLYSTTNEPEMERLRR